jgi:hypothetical protein
VPKVSTLVRLGLGVGQQPPTQSQYWNRCTASPNNPDAISVPRTAVLTDELIHLLDSKSLWEKYGINDDIIVSIGFPHSIYVLLIDITAIHR